MKNKPKNYLPKLRDEFEWDQKNISSSEDLEAKEYTMLYAEIKSFFEKFSSECLIELRLQLIEKLDYYSRNNLATLISFWALFLGLLSFIGYGIPLAKINENNSSVKLNPSIPLIFYTFFIIGFVFFLVRLLMKMSVSVRETIYSLLNFEPKVKTYLQLKLMCIDEILEERKQSALSDEEFKEKYGSIDLALPL